MAPRWKPRGPLVEKRWCRWSTDNDSDSECYSAAAIKYDVEEDEVQKVPMSDLRAFILSEPLFLAGDDLSLLSVTSRTKY